ncbi:SDR family NAD(P)-dependent oxidoreductase [Rhizobium sp. BK251]|uniref:SDR family NAD(P)-dependent oxidoreductase n=1 Tax=Rhizobium sp. BK251 TaxID=2512125 RepID=UPI0010F35B24|nr:SDR family NAD(P)-dependent oxidoreductase [Rhizobium sp. BK251]TCL72255.1 NADP-dependent 3-hydroxy acid dehydrogenase YdfG [Rhizobium sp. BK251]
MWTEADLARQDGRRVIVTGGVSGIGYQVARAMGAKGAQVLIAGRDREKGGATLADLRRTVPNGDFAFRRLDLADLASIAAFSDSVLQDGHQINLLLNIAGVMAVRTRTLTTDGFEMHMGTNFLGHFALTGRLLPALKAAAGARVVMVSARAASWYKIDLSDLQCARSYGPMRAYGLSKLAGVMFAVELNQRTARAGITSIAVDPGTANTSIQRHTPGVLRWFANRLIDIVGYPLDRVADPVLFAATAAEARPDAYIGPTRLIQASGPPGYIKLPEAARNHELREKLWQQAEALTGVRFSFS